MIGFIIGLFVGTNLGLIVFSIIRSGKNWLLTAV